MDKAFSCLSLGSSEQTKECAVTTRRQNCLSRWFLRRFTQSSMNLYKVSFLLLIL